MQSPPRIRALFSSVATSTIPTVKPRQKKTLASFHLNVSLQKFDENGNLTNPPIAWDQDAALTIGSDSFVEGLKAYGTVFPGLVLLDVYRIAEGDRGSVVYRVQGQQSQEFLGMKPGGRNMDFFQA